MPVKLPPDFVVERQGDEEKKHVFMAIEGTAFELRADDARALGTALIHAADDIDGDEGGAAA